LDGILLINKPKGITSYDVVRVAKKVLGTKKIGHTGTLDPFAEGLIILCVGKATKLVKYFLESDKTYEGVIVFNNHYDTYDVTGKIVETDNKVVNKNELEEVFKSYEKPYMQMPPIYSAIKKDGKSFMNMQEKILMLQLKKEKLGFIN